MLQDLRVLCNHGTSERRDEDTSPNRKLPSRDVQEAGGSLFSCVSSSNSAKSAAIVLRKERTSELGMVTLRRTEPQNWLREEEYSESMTTRIWIPRPPCQKGGMFWVSVTPTLEGKDKPVLRTYWTVSLAQDSRSWEILSSGGLNRRLVPASTCVNGLAHSRACNTQEHTWAHTHTHVYKQRESQVPYWEKERKPQARALWVLSLPLFHTAQLPEVGSQAE